MPATGGRLVTYRSGQAHPTVRQCCWLAVSWPRLAFNSRYSRMNEFQQNLADTAERTLAERHMEAVRQQGGMFVEAVRVTRMPMLVTDATLPGQSDHLRQSGLHQPIRLHGG